MNHQTQAQIYLADQRGYSQMAWFRSFHTFNFGQYFDESRQSFGSLQVFNDTILAAGHRLKMKLETNTDVIILPIIGGLEYENSLENDFLENSQMQIFSAAKGIEFEIINPYEAETIAFLEIWLKNDSESFVPNLQKINIDLSQKNQLFALSETIFIGKYDGRNEGNFMLKNPKNGIFAFVIDGVFEVQNRLLHARDGLALSNIEAIEFEALSENALILLLEIEL